MEIIFFIINEIYRRLVLTKPAYYETQNFTPSGNDIFYVFYLRTKNTKNPGICYYRG